MAAAPDPPIRVDSCVFCRILDGDAAAHVVLDDDVALGFLDNRPLFPGHVLVVPRDHHETLVDLPVETIGPLMARAQRVAAAVVDVLGAQGSFVAMNNTVSQSVPHLHVHVVPRTKGDGLRGFFWPRNAYGTDDLDADAHAAEVAARLRAALTNP